VTTAGVSHSYLLSVPASAAPTRPAPLVLLFHGFASDARGMAALTNMPALGKAQGFVVVTPDGPNHIWQLSGTGSDAAFVDDIVATVAKTHCIDMGRIYAAGFSQGAAFAIVYACAPRPARVAAIATVAVDFQLGCTRRLPGVKVRGTILNMGDWARLDRCERVPATLRIGTEVTLKLKTWPHCTKGTAVALITIEHGSHTWPGANPAASPLYTTRQISATKLILRFFAERGQPKRTIESAPNARQ
jgi:polyhydroxybutyrate depolymerase